MYRITLKLDNKTIATHKIENDWANGTVYYGRTDEQLKSKDLWVKMNDVLCIEWDEYKE